MNLIYSETICDKQLSGEIGNNVAWPKPVDTSAILISKFEQTASKISAQQAHQALQTLSSSMRSVLTGELKKLGCNPTTSFKRANSLFMPTTMQRMPGDSVGGKQSKDGQIVEIFSEMGL